MLIMTAFLFPHIPPRPHSSPVPVRVCARGGGGQVKPICVAHKWNVQTLEEFVPPNAGLLGMNVNRKKIFIRLRPASDVGELPPHPLLTTLPSPSPSSLERSLRRGNAAIRTKIWLCANSTTRPSPRTHDRATPAPHFQPSVTPPA